MNYDTQICAVDYMQTVSRALTFEDTNNTGESKMEVAIILAVAHKLTISKYHQSSNTTYFERMHKLILLCHCLV